MSIGIWQIVIIAIILGVPAIAIWSERTNVTIGRLSFLFWLFLFYGAPILVGMLSGLFGFPEQYLMIGALIYSLIMFVPFFRNLVRRARDAGISKIVCYIAIIPLFNLFLYLALLFWPPKERPEVQLPSA